MVNFGLLTAEICWQVWGTPANFNGFCILAALLHSQTAALNRGCHLYSTGRPSRWALAHISSFVVMFGCLCCVEAADPWIVTADDRMKYDAQFYQLQPVAGFLSGTFS